MNLSARIREPLNEFALDVNLELVDAAFTAVVGPSGSGKTTLLRCIAGLRRAHSGFVKCGKRVWQDDQLFVPTYCRPIGYVFQKDNLFSHLSVRRNLEFAIPARQKASSRKMFDETIALLGVDSLIDRKPATLSGGECQRIAIARALLSRPALLLMDEPLSSLDLDSRKQIAPYLAQIHARLHIPVLYVTHAPAEIVHLATSIAYLQRGRLLAHGPVNEIFTRADLPLSRYEDAGAALDLPVVDQDVGHHLMQVALGDALFLVAKRELSMGAKIRVFIRARDVAIARKPPEASSIQNQIAATVLDIHEEAEPAHRLVRLSVQGSTLLARVTAKTVAELSLKPDDQVFAQVKSVALAA